MKTADICKEYRESKNKKQQITILADLNSCSKEDIIKILVEGGEDVNFTKASTQKQPEPKQKLLPEAVVVALYNQLEILDQEIKKREQQYKDIVEFIHGGGQQA